MNIPHSESDLQYGDYARGEEHGGDELTETHHVATHTQRTGQHQGNRQRGAECRQVMLGNSANS